MSKMKSNLRIIFLIINALIYRLITFVVPKKQNRWIFGCWAGKNFSDNSRVLFEYVQKFHPEIESVWIAKNEKVLNEVKALGFRVIDYRTIRGKLFIMRAEVCVQTEGNADTGCFKISRSKNIQLWHGIGDAKTTYDRMNPIKKILVEIYANSHKKSFWMTSSDHQKANIHDYFGTPFQKIFVTGTPRTDVIVDCKMHAFFEEKRTLCGDSKFIAYMPTHRNFGNNQYNILNHAEMNAVNNFLIDNNMFLFIKPHPLEAYKYKDSKTKFSNVVVLLDERFNNTQSFLHYFDALISDYSSVSYDYLCLNRPIILFTYDYEQFVKTDMGLRDEYKKLAPGPLCGAWNDVCKELHKAFSDDSFRTKRECLISRYYKYLDNQNCRRVYEQICRILADE